MTTSHIIQEAELEFTFPGSLRIQKLDQQGVAQPKGMAFVDLVIEKEKQTLLVEIKDPSHSKALPKDQAKYLRRIQSHELINEELTPKARDSYTYLHLMARDGKPFVYVVLLGLDVFSNESAILLGFKDRLLRRLRQETDTPWARHYIHDCAVMSVTNWNAAFPEWPIRRLSSGTP